MALGTAAGWCDGRVWVNNTVNPPPPLPRPGSCRSSDSKHRHNISWWRWSKNFLGPTSEIRVRPVKTFCLPRKKNNQQR